MYPKILTVYLVAAILSSSVAAQEPDGATLLNMTFPYPYQGGRIRLTSAGVGASPTAIVSFARSNHCGGGTSFASTTTINLPIDCLGAATLSTTARFGRCPLGHVLPPPTVDTVTSTPSTQFGFTCAPTPPPASGASSSYQLEDVTRTLPIPTLRPGQTPPEKPVSLQVVHHADGTCLVKLELEQVDPAYQDRRERIHHECSERIASPTVYAATTTARIIVNCDGCQYIRGGDLTTTCPGILATVPAGTVTASVKEATTRWVYDCEGRK